MCVCVCVCVCARSAYHDVSFLYSLLVNPCPVCGCVLQVPYQASIRLRRGGMCMCIGCMNKTSSTKGCREPLLVFRYCKQDSSSELSEEGGQLEQGRVREHSGQLCAKTDAAAPCSRSKSEYAGSRTAPIQRG